MTKGTFQFPVRGHFIKRKYKLECFESKEVFSFQNCIAMVCLPFMQCHRQVYGSSYLCAGPFIAIALPKN